MQSGQVDFASSNATAARALQMSFAQPHLEVEAGFLVSSNSMICSIAEVDRDGVRVGVIQGSTTKAKFAQEFNNAVLTRAPSIAAAQRAGQRGIAVDSK